MSKKKQQLTETDEFLPVRAGFEECYQEFAASGFDTLLIMKFLRRVTTEEDFAALGGSNYYRWRCLFEYFLRRLPENHSIERELLSLRVQDLWIKQRESEAREIEYKNQESITDRTIREVFKKLLWYGVIPEKKYNGYENAQDEEGEPDNNPNAERDDEAQSQHTDGHEEESVVLENNQVRINISQLSRLLKAVQNAGISVDVRLFAEAFGHSHSESIRTIAGRYAGERAKNSDLKRLIRELSAIVGETNNKPQLAGKQQQKQLKL